MIKQICQVFVQAITMRHVKYSLQQQLIILYFSLLWNYGIAVTFCFFLILLLTLLFVSLLIRFSVIEVTQKEVVTLTSDPRSYEYYLNSSKNKRARAGLEPITFAIPVQRSTR